MKLSPITSDHAVTVIEQVDDTVQITLNNSPFRMDRKVFRVEAHTSVASLVREHIPPQFAAQVWLNGVNIEPDARSLTITKPGDCLVMRAIPGSMGGGGGGANGNANKFAHMALMVAAIVVNIIPGIGQALSLALMVAIAVLGMVSTLIINALIPPPKPTMPQVTSTPASFSISGGQNVVAQDSVFPKTYGVRQIYPLQAADPYEETVGNDQYLRQIFCLGYGPLDISQVKLGDTLLVEYEDVEWEMRAGYPDDDPITIYTDAVTEDNINVLLAEAPNNVINRTGWQQQTSGTDADEIAVDITFPNGLYSTGKGNGAVLSASVTILVQYAPTGTTTWVQRPKTVVTAGAMQARRRTIRWQVDPGQYDIQVQVSNVSRYKGVSQNPIFCDTYWTGLRTIRDRSPYALAGLAFLAVRIRASKQLSGIISNLNLVAGSILPDWDGHSWGDTPGSWELDFDNTGAGAFKYGINSTTPHTTTARTGSNAINNESIGTSTGATSYSGTLINLPIQPGSVHFNPGGLALIDDGVGNLHTDGSEVNKWVSTTAYVAGQIARQNGLIWIALLNNTNKSPQANPTDWQIGGSGTINYATGAWAMTLGSALAAPTSTGMTASYVQQVITAGAGKCFTIQTATGTDGAGVSCKNVIVHQEPQDETTGITTAPIQFLVSGWYNASVPITKGIRLRVYWGGQEDFAVSQALSFTDVIADGSGGTGWQQASATVTAPDFRTSSLSGNNVGYARVVVYHNPDAIGGVIVSWDDISMTRANGTGQKVQLIPNPSFDYLGRITSNPASHYRDVLQGRANKLSYLVPDSKVDLLALQAWHDDCNSNNRLNNMILDTRQGLFDVLHAIAAMGRASPARTDSQYSVIQDLPQSTPIQHFTMHNSWDFKSVRSFPQLPGYLKVDFINPDKNWQRDTRTVYDDGFTPATVNILSEKLDLTRGCTNPDQAWREGRYHLSQARLRPEKYQINVSVENIVCRRGDLVYVSHDVPAFGLGAGRVTSVQLDGSGNCTGITTDESFSYTTGTAYAMRERLSIDGESLLQNLTNPGTSVTNVHVFATHILAANKQPSPGDLVMFGVQGSETIPLLVTKITPGKDLSATLYMADYVPAIYTADSGTPPPFDYGATVGPIPAPPVILSARSDDAAMVRQPDGSMESRIVVMIQPVSGTVSSSGASVLSPSNPYASIDVSFRRSIFDGQTNAGAAWDGVTSYVIGDTVTYTPNGIVYIAIAPNSNQDPTTTDGVYWTTLDLDDAWVELATQPYSDVVYVQPVSPGVLYDVRLRYRLKDNNVTLWAEIDAHQVAGQVTPPEDITNLEVEVIETGGALLTWTASTSLNIKTYEVRRGSTFAGGIVLGQWNANGVIIDTTFGAGSVTYFVAAIDTSGNYSTTPPSVSALLVVNGGIKFTGAYSGSTAYKVDDEVTFGSALWICTVTNTGNTPALGSSFWELVAPTSMDGLPDGSTRSLPVTQVYTTAGSYSFTVPAAVNHIQVFLWGAGGGGGRVVSGASAIGAGAGGGAYVTAIIAVTAGQILNITVGAGGTGSGGGGVVSITGGDFGESSSVSGGFSIFAGGGLGGLDAKTGTPNPTGALGGFIGLNNGTPSIPVGTQVPFSTVAGAAGQNGNNGDNGGTGGGAGGQGPGGNGANGSTSSAAAANGGDGKVVLIPMS